MSPSDLIIGIDGGGTKTTAWLSYISDPLTPCGRGSAGPSNIQTVGFTQAAENLEIAINQAFAAANMSPSSVAAICAAVAGAGRVQDRQKLINWLEDRCFAQYILVTHDAHAVLAAGGGEHGGIALIAGTGSLAFGHSREKHTARVGGWGPLFGDEGSGYAIAAAALRRIAHAADGRAPPTLLTEKFLRHLNLGEPQELIPRMYHRSPDRAAIASWAKLVSAAADEGDDAALTILSSAAKELAQMVVTLAQKLNLDSSEFPLSLAGGALLHGDILRDRLTDRINEYRLNAKPLTLVEEPVLGAVRLASDLIQLIK